MDYDVETVAQTGKSFFYFDKLLEITYLFPFQAKCILALFD